MQQKRRRGMISVFRIFAVLLGLTLVLCAQTVQVKTVPILSCDQFNMVPSFRQDMGDVSIALTDSLQDPYLNPAKNGGALSHVFFAVKRDHWNFSRETAYRQQGSYPYNSSEESSAGASLLSIPIGCYVSGHSAYGGGVIALQQISNISTSNENFKANNFPLSLFAGVRVPSLALKIGAGITHIKLNGMDGVYLLYPNATRLHQNGKAEQYRIGLDVKFGAQHLGLLAMRYLYRLSQSTNDISNKDENEGWVVQSDVIRSLPAGWSLGALITADWRYHPKIPEYPLAGIPRDPGHTQALQLGLGCKWQNSTTVLGIDAIYEPIDVKTWAEAAAEIKTWDNQYYQKGDVTMRNDYHFRNRVIRSGAQFKVSPYVELRTGAQFRLYEYDYYQNDFINHTETTGKPQRKWTESAWTGGMTINLPHVHVNYSMRLVAGTGLLERQWLWRWAENLDFAKADFIIPPTVQLNVTPVTYVTQWLGLSWTF
jgi:hypothetical protein